MQIQKTDQIHTVLQGIVHQCAPQVQMCLLQFLQTEILMNIATWAQKQKKKDYFYKLAFTLGYFRNYLNRVDRSFYYLFYEQKEFRTLEQSYIINIAQSTEQRLIQYKSEYDLFFSKLYEEISFVSDKDSLKATTQEIFLQPYYPLPACKRQTIGMYCQTPYQQFMCLIRFPMMHSQQYMQEPLQEMRKYFTEEINLQKLIEQIQQNQQNINKITTLRFCPEEVGKIMWENMVIQGFKMHNVILALFAIVQVSVKTSKLAIQNHGDHVMKIAEFVTRANVYKNVVLAAEEKFGYIFQAYGQIFEMVYKGINVQNLPKFQFWNGAMTMWTQQFKQLQQQLFDSYNYILLKQRQKNICNYLLDKSESFPSIYNSLTLQIQQNSLFEVKRKETYSNRGQVFQNFFQDNIDSYQILGKDFLQHQVDIALNQLNVHKCGHSQHVISQMPYFWSFIENLKYQSHIFYSHLQTLIYKKFSDKQMRLGMLKDLIKCDLQFLNEKYTKPVILKQILLLAQQLMSQLVNNIPEFSVFPEQFLAKFDINYDFSHKDNLLDYFCAKSQTPNDCKPELRNFYYTYKDKSKEEIIQIARQLKNYSSVIDSEIQEEFYQSQVSNNSQINLEQI